MTEPKTTTEDEISSSKETTDSSANTDTESAKRTVSTTPTAQPKCTTSISPSTCTTVPQSELSTSMPYTPSPSISPLPLPAPTRTPTPTPTPETTMAISNTSPTPSVNCIPTETTTCTSCAISTTSICLSTSTSNHDNMTTNKTNKTAKTKNTTTKASAKTATSQCKKLKSSKSKKARQKQAQSLSNEMQTYIYSNPRTTAYRAATYRPSLETFQKVSFANYVRRVLLGVPVVGVEPEDPYYSSEDNDDDDEEEEKEDNDEEGNNEENNNEDGDQAENHVDNNSENGNDVSKRKIEHLQDNGDKTKTEDMDIDMDMNMNTKMDIDIKNDNQEINDNINEKNQEGENVKDEEKNTISEVSFVSPLSPPPSSSLPPPSSPPSLLPLLLPPSRPFPSDQPLQISSITNQSPSAHPTQTSVITAPQHLNQRATTDTASTSTTAPTTEPTASTRSTRSSTRRVITRSQTKSIPATSGEKENIYSKPYYRSPQRRQLRKKVRQRSSSQEKVSETNNTAMSANKTKDDNKGNTKSNNNSNNNTTSKTSSNTNSNTNKTSKIKIVPPKIEKKILVPEPPQKLELDSLKLSDGIAKITPPKGWWDHAGIGNDLTGRGEPWQSGSKLGDLVIPQPIKQCAYGIGGVYDFTMLELPSSTVADFRKDADAYRKRQIGSAFDEGDDASSDERMDLLARKFWRRLGPTMESSKYGADMEGSLFDGDDACGWNVDKLESCLQLLLADMNNKDLEELNQDKLKEEDFRMPGVTSAYLYFGMWASVFCAHTEDINLLSINYLHAGAPKYWYAISPDDSGRFESLMTSLFSHQSANCKEFLRHKRSLVSPSILTKAGIEYTTMVQRAGEIMITYPGSYHFGFNTGFNIAESTNFAVPEWTPLGDKARICMCHPHSVRIDMKRFKSLLDQYDTDQRSNAQNGLPVMSYLDWARENLRSKTEQKRQREEAEDNESQEATTNKIQKRSRSSKGVVVEVLKLLGSDVKPSSSKKSSRKKKSLSSKKKKKEKDDFRLAVRVKKSSLSDKKQTPVLCLLECGSEYNYFAGTVCAIVENHARIHFTGSSRADDIWMDVQSDMLFLDGGPCEKPAS